MKYKKKRILDKLKNKYRLIIFNDSSYEEVWGLKLSRLNVFAVFGSAAIVLITIVILTIALTPLREYIPGYPDGNMRTNIISNVHKLDSLQHEIKIRDRYFNNMKMIIRGEVPESFISAKDSIIQTKEVNFTKSENDSLLREQIEKEELFNLAMFSSKNEKIDLSKIYFYPPVKGEVSAKFNPDISHYGTDIGPQDNVVLATLDGTVTFASWTVETGYVVQIQHDNNFISLYKHNAELLKNVGDRVEAGEAIAIIGNSGELYTSGPHLHFELWHNGRPLDAEDYIDF
ncbi:MAG: M23 family metallopeptidase [Bacteroidota bacterium]|nr:M23 family metallopeptidase [Bacteroidota bacterium]